MESMKSYGNYSRVSIISIPPYCAAAREYDTAACYHLRYMNYIAHPNYFNRGTGSKICRVCPHCVGRYSVYPKIAHGFLWSIMRRSESYSVHVEDQLANIDNYVSYTRYASYLAGLTDDTYYDCNSITYSFHIVRLYINKWHAGRHAEYDVNDINSTD